MVQKGPCEIGLKDKGSFLVLLAYFPRDQLSDLFKLVGTTDPIPSIRELSWFDDPDISLSTQFPFIELLHKLFELGILLPALDMVCQGDNIEHVSICQTVVLSE